MANKKLNGSADLLAQALRQVFQETVGAAQGVTNDRLEKLDSDMKKMNKTTNKNMQELRTELQEMNKTTNENMQSQFAEQEKKIGKMLNPDTSA